MPAPPERTQTLTKEAFEQIAREQAGLTLAEADRDALLEIVRDLQDEAAEAAAVPHDGEEPATGFSLEAWPHD